MQQTLINITDVRKYRQISQQINQDDFNSRANGAQNEELCDLLGAALFYDFMNFLTQNWINYAGVVNRTSDTTLTLENFDASGWVGYSLKLNGNVFVIITAASFDGTDTVLTVTGNNLTNEPNEFQYVPGSITTTKYKTESAYIKLLNGTTYTFEGNPVDYSGLRGFLSWHWLSGAITDGDLKHTDLGNINFLDNTFAHASGSALKAAKSQYLQKVIFYRNEIVRYLDTESSDYPLWTSTAQEENRVDFDFSII